MSQQEIDPQCPNGYIFDRATCQCVLDTKPNEVDPRCPPGYFFNTQLCQCEKALPPPPNGKATKLLFFGDTDTTSEALQVQTQILKEPDSDLVIGLGDYPYASTSTKWCNMMDQVWTPELKAKLMLIQGNHEDEESTTEQAQKDIEEWVNKHNAQYPQFAMPKLDFAPETAGLDQDWEQSSWLSSRHINNVYVINMNTQDQDREFTRNQFNYVTKQIDIAKDLKTQGKVDWVIVTGHKPWFTLKTTASPYTALRNLYNDMFRNVVDFNLHGHNHNTQLWKPLIVDKTQEGNGIGVQLFSMLPDGKTFDFSKDHGWFTIVSGHAGHEHNVIKPVNNPNVLWYNSSDYGYTQLDINGKQAHLMAKDITSKILYEYNVVK